MHIETTCDFCEKDPAVFILPVREFVVPGFEDYPPRSADWDTCARCAKLINADRWEDLVTRALALKDRDGRGRTLRPEVREMLVRMYWTVRGNVTGELRPID